MIIVFVFFRKKGTGLCNILCTGKCEITSPKFERLTSRLFSGIFVIMPIKIVILSKVRRGLIRRWATLFSSIKICPKVQYAIYISFCMKLLSMKKVRTSPRLPAPPRPVRNITLNILHTGYITGNIQAKKNMSTVPSGKIKKKY